MSNPREDQLLYAIGSMAHSFARVEAQIVDCLAILINPGNLKIGELISDRLSLNQAMELVSVLLASRDNKASVKAFSSLCKDIRKAAATRNDVMHSSWSTPSAGDDTEWEIIQERARKRHITPRGHALEGLLSRLEEATFFIQEVEMNALAFRRNYIDSKMT